MSGLPGTPGFPGFDGPKGKTMLEILHSQTNTTIQHFGICFFFIVFERSRLCSPRLHLFDRKYKKKLILLNIIQI